MHEISPVLAGTYNQPDAASVQVNFNQADDASSTSAASGVTGTTSTNSVDPRRYTKFDRTASNAGSTTNFSFSDLLDAINPLQHIPVISSAYRDATGETINPVARVAGDILFGGPLGVVAAVAGGVGGVRDSVLEQQTGKDTTGTVVAALFGNDTKTPTQNQIQLASASNNPAAPSTATAKSGTSVAAAVAAAMAQAAPSASAAMSTPSLSPMLNAQLAAAQQSATTNTATVAAAASTPGAMPLQTSKMFALDRSKLVNSSTTAGQAMTMAVADAQHTTRVGNTIYTNKFIAGQSSRVGAQMASAPAAASVNPPAPVPVNAPTAAVTNAPAASNVAVTTPAATSSLMSTSPSSIMAASPSNNQIPQSLLDNMVMMKALGQYNSVAGSGYYGSGSKLDIMN